MAVETADMTVNVGPDIEARAALARDTDIALTPPGLTAREDMDAAMFDAIMRRGVEQAEAGLASPAADVFAVLRRELRR